MVEFIDIDEIQPERALPSVAMNFNGVYIEEEIEGYQTLNVTGRESVAYNIDTISTQSVDGELVTGKTLQARVLTIQYEMKADTNLEFQEKYRQLSEILHTQEDVPIFFRDDLVVKYNGQLESIGEIDPSRNTVVGTFSIFCADPLRYSRTNTITGLSSSVIIHPHATLPRYELTPHMIRIKPDGDYDLAGKVISITNTLTGRKIVLSFEAATGYISANNYIGVDIKNNEVMTRSRATNLPVTGGNYIWALDFEVSDFHEFKVRVGDQITISPAGLKIEIVLGGAW